MAPEFPIDLMVLALRFEKGELIGSIHCIERGASARDQRLRVTWNVTAPPDGFYPVAGGAVYVATTPETMQFPIYDAKLDALGNDRYGGSYNTGTELMMVIVFPEGYAPQDSAPHPERAWTFDRRLVAYWKFDRDRAEVMWTIKPSPSVEKEVIQVNRKHAQLPRRPMGGLVMDEPIASRSDVNFPTILLGALTLAFLMCLIFYGPRDLPSDYKPLVRLIAALACGLLAGLFTGRLNLEGRLPAFADAIASNSLLMDAAGGFAVFVFVMLFWAH
jgi:hypothetical protein